MSLSRRLAILERKRQAQEPDSALIVQIVSFNVVETDPETGDPVPTGETLTFTFGGGRGERVATPAPAGETTANGAT